MPRLTPAETLELVAWWHPKKGDLLLGVGQTPPKGSKLGGKPKAKAKKAAAKKG